MAGLLIEEALKHTKTRSPVTAKPLVDQLMVAFEGGFVLARSLNEGNQVAKDIQHYRNYLQLLFSLEPAEPVSL